MENIKLIKYNGNEKEFEEYRKKLNQNNIDTNNNKKYFGEIVNNLYEGFGKLYEFNKLKYEGFFSKGLYSGKGILYENNKKIYDGYFFNGVFDGIGIEYLFNGNRKRKAFYSEGKICEECNGVLYNDNNEEI